MRTATRFTARRVPRVPACDDRPRLWGDETAATAAPTPAVAPAAAHEPAEAPAAPTALLAAEAVSPPARSLDDVIADTWDGLVAGEAIACPVCTASMTPRWSAGAGVVGGRCGGCGTTLE